MRIVRACVRFSETINIELFSESQPSVAKKERERKSQTGEIARKLVESAEYTQLSRQPMDVCLKANNQMDTNCYKPIENQLAAVKKGST